MCCRSHRTLHWALKPSGVVEVISHGSSLTSFRKSLSFLNFFLPCLSIRVNVKLFRLMSTVVMVVEYRRKLRSRESSNGKPLCLNLLKAILLLVLDVQKVLLYQPRPLSTKSYLFDQPISMDLQSKHIPQPMNINKGSPPLAGPAQL